MQKSFIKMDFNNYLDKFQKAANQLDKRLFVEKQLEIAVGVITDSIFLKLYKKSWATPFQDALTAKSRIFFSVWVSDSALAEHKILYNIHALKLRKLQGYKIQSRDFAAIFRAGFKDFEHKWENVGVQFGPLTLMEGWLKIDPENFEGVIIELANNFLSIAHLIDETLAHFK